MPLLMETSMKKVAIFGSSRTNPESGLYSAVEKMGKDFASYGWVVVTGGGPGTMEAATKVHLLLISTYQKQKRSICRLRRK